MASRLRLEQSLEFARTLQKGQLVTLEGNLRYPEVTEDAEGVPFKHRIAEIRAISMKRLSKIEAADDPFGAIARFAILFNGAAIFLGRRERA